MGATLALAVAVNPLAQAASGLKLHPNGFGQKSYAAWKAQEGLPDSNGNANHALYFQKMTATETFAAGIAEIKGVEGTPVSALQGLEWQHRNDGWCGAGAPRWNVVIQGANGTPYTLQLGCIAAAHTPGDAANWTRDTYTSATIVSTGASNQGITDPTVIAAIAAGTVQALYIVFDEGTTLNGQPYGPGFVFLDNIVVTINGVLHTWTSPADNGR